MTSFLGVTYYATVLHIYTLPTIQLYISIKLQEIKKERRRKTYIFKLNPDQEKTLWNLLLYGTVCQNRKQISSDSIKWGVYHNDENYTKIAVHLLYRICITYYKFFDICCIIFFLGSNS